MTLHPPDAPYAPLRAAAAAAVACARQPPPALFERDSSARTLASSRARDRVATHYAAPRSARAPRFLLLLPTLRPDPLAQVNKTEGGTSSIIPPLHGDLQHNLCIQMAIVGALGLPGYYISVWLMDKLGRRIIQLQVIMSPCHHVIMSPCHLARTAQHPAAGHHVTMPACHHVTMSSCHPDRTAQHPAAGAAHPL